MGEENFPDVKEFFFDDDTFNIQKARTIELCEKAASETRNTCTYCSVACGILIYSLGDRAKNAVSDVIHIEGDPDHPVNRGTLCPKGSALLRHRPFARPAQGSGYRAPGANGFKEVSWISRSTALRS